MESIIVNEKASVVGSIDNERTKQLTLLQIFLLNSVVCGIEICACAGFTYIPPLLLKNGFSEENMSLILGFGPLLSLFCTPVIGRASDKCHCPYGRRRPFILAISIVLIFSLYLIPFGESFISMFIGKGDLSKRLGILLMTFGSVMLDFTSQTCLTPCEALLNDACKNTGQQERVFSVYSLMVSSGGIIGYLLSAINWRTNSVGQYFGGEEASIFSILIIMFTLMLSATLIVAAEKPLLRYPKTSTSNEQDGHYDELVKSSQNAIALESGYESSSSSRSVSEENLHNILVTKETNYSVSYSKSVRSILPHSVRNCLTVVTSKSKILSHICDLTQTLGSSVYNLLPTNVQQFLNVPVVLRHLALANFCSWTAVMSFNLYFTDFVGQIVYRGNPNAPEDSEAGNLYDEGVRMGSWGLLLHCITSAVYSFFIERLVDKYGSKMTYMMGMTSFCFAMTGMVLVPNVYIVNLMAAMTGFAFATLTTIPFILVSRYHEEKELFFFDVITTTSSSNHGIGTYIATLDSAYFLSQVILTACVGYIVHITGTVTAYMVSAGCMGLFSVIFINKIVVTKQELVILCNDNKIDLKN
ncbi:hypothetical protein SNE40_003133 [Patella caerulea]|uniref:Uncharacterized protein n=1 Tax=Patella caerulea TaxID=87958 RepID=A0AAN8KDL1_PATCE